jgi:FAD/FMN-containing dehydrogenase
VKPVEVAVISDTVPEPLAARLRGPLPRPGIDGRDAALVLWNTMIHERPALVAHCTDGADVVEAVRFARRHGLTVTVCEGWHMVTGLGSIADGLMIDLSLMRSVQADPGSKTAPVQGGTLWGDVAYSEAGFSREVSS